MLQGRLRTRRRLGLAFSGVLVSLLLAMALQSYTLRRIESTVDAMEQGDEQLKLTLQLEAAFREQYGLQGQIARGAGVGLSGYQAARGRVQALIERLQASTGDAEALEELGAVQRAAVQLDRAFREQVMPAAPDADSAAELAHDRSYPLVLRIEQAIDETLARLHATIRASRVDIKGLERTSLWLLAAAFAVTLVLAAMAIAYLARSVARPLALLSQGAAALGRGDLDARIELRSRDEFGVLAAELNSMAAALKEHQARLVE